MLRYIIMIINEVPTERCRLTAVKYVAQSTKGRSDDNRELKNHDDGLVDDDRK